MNISRTGLITLVTWCLWNAVAFAQRPVISDFKNDGTLTCSNMKSGTTYSVEVISGELPTGVKRWSHLTRILASGITVTARVPITNQYALYCRVKSIPLLEGNVLDMVFIPSGTNTGTNPLASGESYEYRYPATYSLAVTSFYMCRTEVTRAIWNTVRNWGLSHGYSDLAAGDGKGDNHPVLLRNSYILTAPNWYDCVKWCNALSEMENRSPAYYTTSAKDTVYRTGNIDIASNCVSWSDGYRLPTITEWEYAARGGTSGLRFPWGNTISHSQANYYSMPTVSYDLGPVSGYHPTYSLPPEPYTHPVGALGAHGYGLCDMIGNVHELCWDWYPSAGFRTWCGGSYTSPPEECRIPSKGGYAPIGQGSRQTGFRPVLPVPHGPAGGSRLIEISGDLDFGVVKIGTNAVRTFAIKNGGTAILTVTNISYPSGFFGSWSGKIASGSSQIVAVTFVPLQSRTYSGTVTVNSDATGGASTIDANGTGTNVFRIYGQVKFSSTPRSNAIVELTSAGWRTEHTTTSDSLGFFDFGNVATNGMWLIRAKDSDDTYSDTWFSFYVAGGDLRKDVYLVKTFSVITPYDGEVVIMSSPTFMWSDATAAASYRFQLNVDSPWSIIENLQHVTTTTHTTTKTLSAGLTYSYIVGAYDSGGNPVGSTSFIRFTVTSGSTP